MKKLFPVLMMLLVLTACKEDKKTNTPNANEPTQDPFINNLLKQIENNPTEAALFVQLSRAYYESDNLEDAVKSVKRAITLGLELSTSSALICSRKVKVTLD